MVNLLAAILLIAAVMAWSGNVVLALSETVLVIAIETMMTEHFFDHDRLDVYRLSIEYVAKALAASGS